jgi:acrylyl-CoA reductase (NADPH)
MPTFKAFIARQTDGKFSASLEQVDPSSMTPGEVLIRVSHSSLNYKDGLAVSGKPGVIRKFPMVPGVDLAGTVEESASQNFKPGDRVAVTGCGTSETFWGGYAQYARIDAEYIVPIPEAFTTTQAMGIGTAGFTAMQSVMALEEHNLKPSDKPVLVTGAAGGVGSVAIAILAKLGYKVAASTGRPQLAGYLRSLGATEIVDRFTGAPKRPLDTPRWSAAIDSVGGETLANLLTAIDTHQSVASCGLAGGAPFTTTVFPFILRGVNLLGIDSLRMPNARRRAIWQRLSTDLPLNLLDSMIEIEPLEKIATLGEKILAGQTRGRVVIDINA